MITEQELNKAMRVLNVIFYAILLSLFVYLFVCLNFIKNHKKHLSMPIPLQRSEQRLYVCLICYVTHNDKPLKNFILKKIHRHKKNNLGPKRAHFCILRS